jgi:ATPase subunit of ABC transporter with duplicated ATPase domains
MAVLGSLNSQVSLWCAGFLGVNGSGKSSLMRILAGTDADFEGRLFLANGIKIGYLEQEPKLDAGPTVDDNIRPGLAHMQALLTEYEEVSIEATPLLQAALCK